ncbi:MAG: YncE family protein [Nitrosopumilus sp.]
MYQNLVSTGHHGIDVSPDGNRVYVSGITDDVISVIDVESLEVIKKIKVGPGPPGLRTNSDGSILYVAVTQTNEIIQVDTDKVAAKD